MASRATIGQVAQQTGVPAKTIRFYEAQGVLPPPQRTEAGYRVYTPGAVRRLRLIHRVRLLGISLREAGCIADQAFASDCAEFADQLLTLIASQRVAIDARMAELATLRAELDDLEIHTHHARAQAQPGQPVAACPFCPLIDEGSAE